MTKQILIGDEELFPPKEESKFLKEKTLVLLRELKMALKRHKIKADAFVGGSYAKGTLMNQKEYDIDVFVRCEDEIKIDKMENAIKDASKAMKLSYEKVHGSRDYFFVKASDFLTFEIVPVKKIGKPKEMENSTDLSYFHVNYICKKLKNKKLVKEILLAKKFFKAQEVYGAESWIHGFSGYSIECLIIHYKSLDKMLKEFVKISDAKKLPIIIDIEKFYKNKDEVIINMNESKRKGPIVFVDPTWKERNVLGALGYESFGKLVNIAKKYLKKPNKNYFNKKDFDKNDFILFARKKDAHFIKIKLETEKQAGDIAGSKLVKGSNFIISMLQKRFDILSEKIVYNLGQDAVVYIILKEKKNLEQKGPELAMKNDAIKFRKIHPDAYMRKGRLYVKIKPVGNVKNFVDGLLNKYNGNLREMGIVSVKLIN